MGLFGSFLSKFSRNKASIEDIEEFRTILIESDLGAATADEIVELVKKEKSENLESAVQSRIKSYLTSESRDLNIQSGSLTTILIVGVNGTGKTTSAAKLARWFKSQGRQPLLVGADLQRPAAVDQLRTLGAQVGVPVFSEPGDPVNTARRGLEEARRLGKDILIVDTAGRLAIDEEMMQQVADISRAVIPKYTFLVVDAMTGQDAVSVAKAFDERLAIDGVILSKLDGDARGGAALSVKTVIGKPIAFAATGERIDAFEQFHPDRMAGRILGMGDVLTLIEQAEKVFEADQAEETAARMLEGQFTLEDFLEQLQQLKKMGPLSGIMGMLPGMPKEMKDASIGDDQVKVTEAIIRSMTPEERRTPEIINGSRRTRIATGSGTQVADVNKLIKQFTEMQKMMKKMGGLAKPQGKQGKGKNKVSTRQAMRELGDMFGGAGGPGGFPGMPGAGGPGQFPPFSK